MVALAGLLGNSYIVGTCPVFPCNGTHVAKQWVDGGLEPVGGKANLDTPPMTTAITEL